MSRCFIRLFLISLTTVSFSKYSSALWSYKSIHDGDTKPVIGFVFLSSTRERERERESESESESESEREREGQV